MSGVRQESGREGGKGGIGREGRKGGKGAKLKANAGCSLHGRLCFSLIIL